MQYFDQSVPLSSLPPCDPETFRRVWDRVMPEGCPDCPFVLKEPPGPLPAPPASAGSVPPPPNPVVDDTEDTPPMLSEDGAVSLGRSSAVYIPLLQELIASELLAWRVYQQLARRANGVTARVLSSMAADERRHAKRLSAAEFIISGVRYLPADRKPAAAPGPLPAALRDAFSIKQRAESIYRAAAAETFDDALRALYLELAEEENTHAHLIRSLLEQL